MSKEKVNKLVKWLVIIPLAGVGALVVLLLGLFLVEDLQGSSGRRQTAISRMTSDAPFYEYGYGQYAQDKEKELAVKMKTWDSSYQLISWVTSQNPSFGGIVPMMIMAVCTRTAMNVPDVTRN